MRRRERRRIRSERSGIELSTDFPRGGTPALGRALRADRSPEPLPDARHRRCEEGKEEGSDLKGVALSYLRTSRAGGRLRWAGLFGLIAALSLCLTPGIADAKKGKKKDQI